MKYKRRGRWEGYWIWLASGQWAWADHGRHALSRLRKGLWREGERDFPSCAVVSPCAPLLTRRPVRPRSYLRLPAWTAGGPDGRYRTAVLLQRVLALFPELGFVSGQAG